MKIIFQPILLLCFTLFFSNTIHGQKLSVRNFSAGYRIFEINYFGNNPKTIGPFLKDPVAYQNFVKTIEYNGRIGEPGILRLHTFYLNAELQGSPVRSRFWRKNTLQVGLLLTNKLSTGAGALTNETHFFGQDTIFYNNNYSITKNQQFIGGSVGINRRYTISNKFQVLTGLHFQGSFAFIHNYEQRLDSSSYVLNGERKTSSTKLPNLKGKNFFQWQAMIPLGIEYAVYQQQLYLRLEVDFGIVGSRYIPKEFAAMEAHGAGLSFIYRPQQKK